MSGKQQQQKKNNFLWQQVALNECTIKLFVNGLDLKSCKPVWLVIACLFHKHKNLSSIWQTTAVDERQ